MSKIYTNSFLASVILFFHQNKLCQKLGLNRNWQIRELLQRDTHILTIEDDVKFSSIVKIKQINLFEVIELSNVAEFKKLLEQTFEYIIDYIPNAKIDKQYLGNLIKDDYKYLGTGPVGSIHQISSYPSYNLIESLSIIVFKHRETYLSTKFEIKPSTKFISKLNSILDSGYKLYMQIDFATLNQFLNKWEIIKKATFKTKLSERGYQKLLHELNDQIVQLFRYCLRNGIFTNEIERNLPTIVCFEFNGNKFEELEVYNRLELEKGDIFSTINEDIKIDIPRDKYFTKRSLVANSFVSQSQPSQFDIGFSWSTINLLTYYLQVTRKLKNLVIKSIMKKRISPNHLRKSLRLLYKIEKNKILLNEIQTQVVQDKMLEYLTKSLYEFYWILANGPDKEFELGKMLYNDINFLYSEIKNTSNTISEYFDKILTYKRIRIDFGISWLLILLTIILVVTSVINLLLVFCD